MIALDVDGAGQVDFLCQTNTGYKLLPWGLGIPSGKFSTERLRMR